MIVTFEHETILGKITSTFSTKDIICMRVLKSGKDWKEDQFTVILSSGTEISMTEEEFTNLKSMIGV